MSSSRQEEINLEERRESAAVLSSSSSSSLSSTSLIKLDEISSFGATKQARLPALIKLNPLADLNSRDLQQNPTGSSTNSSSMPDFSGSQLEKMATEGQHQQSLPANLGPTTVAAAEKENAAVISCQQANQSQVNQDDSMDGFQVVEMEQMSVTDNQLVGPSLPQPNDAINPDSNDKNNPNDNNNKAGSHINVAGQVDKSIAASLLNRDQQQYASHLGDSLIEMIISLRNENQNLIKALEVNNSYVKERLDEFKRCQEESKRRELEFQLEKAELEHNLRKVQRQNSVLSDRLKSMEAKLKDMKLEVSESLLAAHSSKTSSIRGEENLYPLLDDTQNESFVNPALCRQQETTTIQMDATSGELYNDGDQHQSGVGGGPADGSKSMETDEHQPKSEAKQVAAMSKEELSKRFDAKKVEFHSIDDPMKQCDQLEQQLNDIGRRDYEICLLQQQLNIYRQDFRLERMAKLEAKIQIEKLKNEIDRLCLDRMGRVKEKEKENADADDELDARQRYGPTPATAAADGLIGKLGHHLSKKALKSAAKAAKYASKQAHLEEKAAAALARAAAAKAAAASHFKSPCPPQPDAATSDQSHEMSAGEPLPPHHHHHHSRRHHHPPRPHHQHAHHRGSRSIRGEIVSDLMNTANKAMLTGYNLASTTINSALDKLSQYEQQQAAQAAEPNRQRPGEGLAGNQATNSNNSGKPSAPPMDMHPSMD